MSYLITHTDYNSTASLGTTENEIIAQSLYFGRNFIIKRAYVRFGTTINDPLRFVQYRCHIKRASGPNNQLDKRNSSVLSSNWFNEYNLVSDSYNYFTFDNSTVIGNGWVYFCFVANMDLNYELPFSIEEGGSFNEKFIHIKDGIGIHRSDKKLAIKIDGTWQSDPTIPKIIRSNDYVSTSIQDRES